MSADACGCDPGVPYTCAEHAGKPTRCVVGHYLRYVWCPACVVLSTPVCCGEPMEFDEERSGMHCIDCGRTV